MMVVEISMDVSVNKYTYPREGKIRIGDDEKILSNYHL